VVGEGFEPS